MSWLVDDHEVVDLVLVEGCEDVEVVGAEEG